VSSGLRIPFLLPAVKHATIHPVHELGRSFGLFEQTVDNAVDGQLPESMTREREILRNARKTVTAAKQVTADTRPLEITVPWFFYMYFYTHSNPELDPALLYRSDLGVYGGGEGTHHGR
jgi:hypothetical protein